MFPITLTPQFLHKEIMKAFVFGREKLNPSQQIHEYRFHSMKFGIIKDLVITRNIFLTWKSKFYSTIFIKHTCIFPSSGKLPLCATHSKARQGLDWVGSEK